MLLIAGHGQKKKAVQAHHHATIVCSAKNNGVSTLAAQGWPPV